MSYVFTGEMMSIWHKIPKKLQGPGVVIAALLLLAAGFWLRGRFFAPASAATEEHADHAPTAQAETKVQVWTCSMHPQIRRYEPGLCPICNMELIPVEEGEGASEGGMRELTVSEAAAKLMDVETVPVERRTPTAVVRMVGKVEYDETRLAYITAWIPGRLDRLFVDYTGVPVRKGDHLVSLYSPQLLSAQEELLQALKATQRISDSSSSLMRETSEATVKAAREKLRLWGLTAEQIAEIEQSGQVSDHMTIYAPVGGIVIHKNALEGMYVDEGTRIYTIADLSRVWIKLDAYESDLQWLRYGQQVEFTTVAYPGETFSGTVAFIDPVLDERTRTTKVRVNVPNLQGKLKPEMFVKAVVHASVASGGRVMDPALAGKWICPMHPEIVKSESGECDICEMPLVTTESLGYVSDDAALAAQPLVIPVSAALVTGTRAVVYVQKEVDGKPTFEGREIVLGPRAGDYYLVRSGLQEGELVVVKGSFKIDSALQILAKPSMMTPEGGGAMTGHQHGGDMPMGTDAPQGAELTPLTRRQLQGVVAAGQEVAKALQEGDLARARQTFGNLKEALTGVDMSQLSGRAHATWMELSMRLTNDAVEGADAQTLEDAVRVGQSLASNLRSLGSQMGVAAEPADRSLPALDAELRRQLGGVYQAYFAMRRVLAGDDANEAASAATTMLAAVKAVDMALFDDAAHSAWMDASTQLREILSRATETNDIRVLREHFHSLSQHLIRLAQSWGALGAETVFVMHCPMAFDNTGAHWLQNSQEVQNPYFGAAMLNCGSVEDAIPAVNVPNQEKGDHD